MLKVFSRAFFVLIIIFTLPDGLAYGLEHQGILEQAAEEEGLVFRNINIDGIISEDEYDSSQQFGDGIYTLYWTVKGEIVSFGIAARTTGWVAVGFDPETRMQNADVVIGWVDDEGNTHVLDSWSSGPTGPHSADVEQGGTEDIISFAGSEANGTTFLEFNRLLDTGDAYDSPLVKESQNEIIWGIGSEDHFASFHTERGSESILLHEEYREPEENAEPAATFQTDALGLWITHASLMVIGLLMMLTAIAISSFFRKNKRWLRLHRGFGLTTGAALIIGFLVAIALVMRMGIPHISNIHAIFGLVTIIIVLLVPTLGFLMSLKSLRKFGKQIRVTHRWLGRLAPVLMIWVIYLGLAMVGII